MKPVDEILGCLIWGGVLVLEADRVGEPSVAKQQPDRRAIALHPVGRIEHLGLHQLAFRVPVDRAFL